MSHWRLCAAFTGQGGMAVGGSRPQDHPAVSARSPPRCGEAVDGGLELAVPPAGDQWAEHRDRDAGEHLDVADVGAAVRGRGEAPQVTLLDPVAVA
jgi:hypothetical protein